MPKLVVVGGGAAGMFCAVNAARLHPHWEVLVLEKTDRLLMKVKISGGGRCNVTHHLFDVPDLLPKYPRGGALLKKELYAFGPAQTIEWFAARGVDLVAEADGRMFPSTHQSQTIIDSLLREAHQYKVSVRTQANVLDIQPAGKGERGARLTLANGENLKADALCLAIGGFPKLSQFDWLKNLGHHIVPPVPSLFTFNLPQHPITALMGVSVPKATVKMAGSKWLEQGPVLVTHWGLSGPAVLRLSARAALDLADKAYQFDVLVNWLGDWSENDLRQEWPIWRQEKGKLLMHKHAPVS
ncbi:MAG: aminoacetone oxidase family FAD-binding enzyme, partial [Sphingobacteriia bacterium]